MSERHLLLNHYGGWRPALPDQRRITADTSGIKILPEVDPRKELPPVYNQMQLGSCTANATAAAFRYDSMLDNKDPGDLSRLWLYYQERVHEGDQGQGDTGAMGHDAFWVAQNVGICKESDWPYDPNEYNDPSYFDPDNPPPAAVHDEGHYKLTKRWATVPQNQRAIKSALSNKQTVAIGFTVYESFESQEVASTGIMPMPEPDEGVLGGHEVLVVGYLKSEPHYALVRNSWGADWGMCLAGDTRVALLDGTAESIAELYSNGEDIWVYTYNPDTRRIEPALAHPKHSGWRKDMVRVTLDNDEVVECTADHPWMLRNGTFARADALEAGTSLMPLYRKNDHGYERFLDPSSHRWITAHWSFVRTLGMKVTESHMAGCSGCKVVVHHLNFNGKDNRPENLMPMWQCVHTELHRYKSPETIEKLRSWWRENYDMQVAISRRNIQAYNIRLATGEVILTSNQIESRRRNGAYVGALPKKPFTEAQYESVRRNAQTMLAKRGTPVANAGSFKRGQKWSAESIAKREATKAAKRAAFVNHKVSNVERLIGAQEVFDLHVESSGSNFALEAGVFVHNSGYFLMPWTFLLGSDTSDLDTIQRPVK